VLSGNSALGREFRERSIHHLRDEFLPRIEKALEVLPAADLWWRPDGPSNSVGNLLLHLEGNVRQWLLSGIGGDDDFRNRTAEFAATESAVNQAAAELYGDLRSTVLQACEMLEGLDDEELMTRHNIQIYEGVTGMAAVLHVVEHFSWHTGQIAYIAKMRAQQVLEFYDDEALE
jgi:uncharacterized damage-inducible protein DinB